MRLHGADLRYSHTWERWLCWDGRRWRIDETGELVRRAAQTVQAIYGEAAEAQTNEERERLAKWALKSESRNSIKSMINLAASEPGVPVRVEELDRDPYTLNVFNGTLDLRIETLRAHRREDLITTLAPVDYDPDARSDLFDSFRHTAISDPDAGLFTQRAVGYTLLGRTGADVLLMVHGPPHTVGVVNALRPGLATMPGSLLLVISSP